MKEAIEQFKKTNGNENFTQKDMLIYVISKIDRIDERLAKGQGKICANRARINGVIKMLTISTIVFIPILCATLGWLFIRTI